MALCSIAPVKDIALKIRPIWLCEIAQFPWQGTIGGVPKNGDLPKKNTHISAATHPRIPIFLPKEFLDIALSLACRIC